MNLGVYDQQQDRLADAASKTRTQNIDILKSISDKYAKNRLENKLARVYQNLYPSYRYDKDGNLVPVGGAVFNVNGQMIGSPGFMPGTGVIPTAQNILTGVGMAQQLGIGDLFKRKPREETVASEITPMASVVANPLEEVLLRQAGKIPQQSTGNWWEEETTSERIGPYAPIIPQGKKGKTVKKNNKNSNILRALKNL
jgi:hypothetical protein